MLEFFILIAIIFLFTAIAAPILAIIALSRTNSLERQLRQIRAQLGMEHAHIKPKVKPQTKPHAQPLQQAVPTKKEPKKAAPKTKTPPPPSKPRFEERFGARLPVWVAAVAFVLAGVYLVHYSIEQQLLTPMVRVLLSSGFGIVLLIAAQWMHDHPKFIPSKRFSQALAGSGLAILFASVYSATNIHGILDPFVGFIGLAIVAGFAVVLSLQFGLPIALLALLGGFLTPALVGAESPNPAPLFSYLFLLYAALMAVITRKGWWSLGLLAYAGALVWSLWWLSMAYSPLNHFWISGFIIAITIANTLAFARIGQNTKIPPLYIYIPAIASFVVLAIILQKREFALIDWGLFSLVGLSFLALARIDPAQYLKFSWIGLAGIALMLWGWSSPPFATYGIFTIGLGTVFAYSGYRFLWSTDSPAHWTQFSAMASVTFYALLYYGWHNDISFQAPPLFWGSIALLIASLHIIAVQRILANFDPKHPKQQQILGSYCIAATALITSGLAIELSSKWYLLALSLEIAALAGLQRKLPLNVLKQLTAVLFALFTLILLPQALGVSYHILHLFPATWAAFESLAIVKDPVWLLAAPLIALSVAHLLLRTQPQNRLVSALELMQGFLLTILIYVVIRQLLPALPLLSQNGILHSLWLLMALAGIWIGSKTNRMTLADYSVGLGWFTLGHLLIFDLGQFNPLWSLQNVGERLFLNNLTLAYALPGMLLTLASCIKDKPRVRQCWTLAGAALLFIYINFTLRHFFQGAYLNQPLSQISSPELYSYSVLWAITGLLLLIIGISRNRQDLRYASLAVMGITASKVFLIDARELVGLWRVISFFGLGVSMLLLGYLYQRFVSEEQNRS